MSAAPSVRPAPLTHPKGDVRKARPRAARAEQRPVPLYAVACCICGEVGPVRTNRELGIHPGKRSGFELRTVAGIAGFWCAGCRRVHEQAKPPATRGECIDGPRPCKRVFCRYHLAFDVSRKADRGFELPESCALDVADAHDEGMTLSQVGEVLGCTREGVRYIEVPAKQKLARAFPELAHAFEHAANEGDEG